MSLTKTLPLWPLPLVAVGVLGQYDSIVLIATVIVAAFPVVFFIVNRGKRPSFIGAPIILFVISAFTGLAVAYNPRLGLPFVVTLLGSGLLFFSLVYANILAEMAAKGVVIFSGGVALYFVNQYAHIGYPDETGFMADVARVTSAVLPNLGFFWLHPNSVAGVVSSTIFLSGLFTWQARHPAQRAGWGVVTALLFYGLLVTGSKGALIALAIALGIFAILYLPQRAQHLAGLSVGLLVGLLVGLFVFIQFAPVNMLDRVPEALFDSTGSRLMLYHNGLNLYKDYPFTGIGPGDTFTMVYSRYQLLIDVPYLKYAHNLFLAVALGQGLLGLIALIWLLAAFYRFIFKVEQFDGETHIPPLFRAAWLGVTITFIHGVTDAVQFSEDRWTLPVLFALLGISVAVGSVVLNRLHVVIQVKVSPKTQLMTLAAVAIVAAGIGLLFRQTLLSAVLSNRGALAQTYAELSPRLENFEKEAALRQAQSDFEAALQINPQNAVAYRRLGMMALEASNFDAAVTHLEQAYQQEPDNQATIKALGYAYLWAGQLDAAFSLFEQVEFQVRLRQELDYWRWQWGERDQDALAAYTDEILNRLAAP
jgi:tetratricopeptide (TPR) repeat protein